MSNYEEIVILCMDRERTLQFLINLNVISAHATCQQCGSDMTRAPYSTQFKCRKRHIVKDYHKRIIYTQCNTVKSIFNGTIFSHSNIPIEKSLKIIAQYILNTKITLETLSFEHRISVPSVSRLIKKVNMVLRQWCEWRAAEGLGGVGRTVEVDETRIGGRKYNRGRETQGQWIFGIYDRFSGQVVTVPVPDRTKITLHFYINKYVKKGSVIISDGWKSYRGLTQKGYIHRCVNHRYQFVNSYNKSWHTQNIERYWRYLKNNLQRFGVGKRGTEEKISKVVFERVHHYYQRVEAFLRILSEYQHFGWSVDGW